ncbi:MAG TPA: integrase [Candidatus Margulisiibacteriota bacterium]|nr:integrase [Candidatus Margulisiibacteriota bacterium]
MSYGQSLKSLPTGGFVTVESRLERGGSLQARRLSTGIVQFYWRYSYHGKKAREPIGIYDPIAPPRSVAPTGRGYSVRAALARCRELGALHEQHANVGGYREARAAERRAHDAKQAERIELGERTLYRLFSAYVEHLKRQGRRSWYDADSLFRLHVLAPWPKLASMPAAQVTPDHVLDMLRRLVEAGKGRTANKLRAYLRAAYQCAIDVRSSASIPVAFKAFAVVFNPAAQTRRDSAFDRADKRPLVLEELRAYWRAIKGLEGRRGTFLRLHLLTGGQRVEQLLRLRWSDVGHDSIAIIDGKGRPGHGGRRHTLPLLRPIVADLAALERKGDHVMSTTAGVRPVSATTLAGWAREAAGGITEFQLKRIRSGVETLLAANGISRDIRGQLQSHGLTGVQARHYDAHDYMAEKRNALEVLFTLLEREPETKGHIGAG